VSKNLREQKETERRHIEELLRRLGIQAVPEYGDSPDAVLVIGGRRVGLEHRELYEEDLAANRPNIDWLAQGLRAELAKLGLGEGVSVSVGLNAAAPRFRKRSQVAELIPAIAQIAQEHAPRVEPGDSVQVNAPALMRRGLGSVSLVVVQRHEYLRGGPHAYVSSSYWGPGESSVLAAVREKEGRLSEYRKAKALDAVWLLLVTGASWTQATDSVLTEWLRVESEYEAVYLLDLRTGQLQCLGTRD
jgi:hypothetical protein